jgi:hypothetical protein
MGKQRRVVTDEPNLIGLLQTLTLGEHRGDGGKVALWSGDHRGRSRTAVPRAHEDPGDRSTGRRHSSSIHESLLLCSSFRWLAWAHVPHRSRPLMTGCSSRRGMPRTALRRLCSTGNAGPSRQMHLCSHVGWPTRLSRKSQTARGCRPNRSSISSPVRDRSWRTEKSSSSTADSSTFDGQNPEPICMMWDGSTSISAPSGSRGLRRNGIRHSIRSVVSIASSIPYDAADGRRSCVAFDPSSLRVQQMFASGCAGAGQLCRSHRIVARRSSGRPRPVGDDTG